MNTANTSSGSSTSTQFKLPLVSAGTYDFAVDWGDTTSDNITVWNQAETTHTYGITGIYTIKISGTCEGWSFSGTGDRLKILDIVQWGSILFRPEGSAFGGAFRLCSNLDVSATDSPTFMIGPQNNFFAGCSSLVYNSSINNWDVSPLTGLLTFFLQTTLFNQPLDNWNVSNVLNLQQTFQQSGFNQNINNWDVGSVTNMDRTFRSSSFNQPLNLWDLNGVTITRGMFAYNSSFNQDISGWDVSTVVTMGSLGEGMFTNCFAFNQNIGDWNVSNVTNFTAFMQGKTSANFTASNLDAIYNGWSSRPVQPGIAITFNTIKHTASGQAGRDILTSAPNNWNITDGGI